MLAIRHNYLGIDYGEKRVGLAIGDSETKFARPLTTLHNDEHLLARLKDVIHHNEIKLLVIGHPHSLNGRRTMQTATTDQFIAHARELGVPIETRDEAVTSELAAERLGTGPHSKEEIDSMAAAIILQDFLDEL